MKVCRKCHETKPLDGFYRNSRSKDGRQGACKVCDRASASKWYASNRDLARASRAAYAAQRYVAMPHLYWAKDYVRRARAYGVTPVVHLFTRDEMIAYWGNGERCIYCDAPFTEVEHLIPVGVGGRHVVENVAPCCSPCNRVNSQTVRYARRSARTGWTSE